MNSCLLLVLLTISLRLFDPAILVRGESQAPHLFELLPLLDVIFVLIYEFSGVAVAVFFFLFNLFYDIGEGLRICRFFDEAHLSYGYLLFLLFSERFEIWIGEVC